MERLLQQFEQAIRDTTGASYRVYLHGRSRPANTWQGWLVFERLSDGQRFATDVETTQPNAEAIVYWATGLSGTYFDGALSRALRPSRRDHPSIVVPEPIVGGLDDSGTRRKRLAKLERAVLACFSRRQTERLLTKTVLDDLQYAHADVVRALEDLEKQGGLLVRRTKDGNDWLLLTQAGLDAAAATAPTVAP